MSSPSYVRLVLDLYDPQGNPLNRGHVTLTPSLALVDVPDMQIIPPASAIADFAPGASPPAVTLLASDSPGPQPAGWAWDIKPVVPGDLEPWSVFTPAGPVSFTATSTNPSVLTWTPAGAEAWQLQQLPAGTGVQLSGGSIPPGFAAGATYYVASSTGYTVELAAYQGGPSLGSLVAGSGQLTVVQWQLSALAPVAPAAVMGGYLPAPGGTASAGQVPVATGSGSTSWAEPFVERSGDAMTGPLSPAVAALADAATVAVNAGAANEFTLQLTSAVGGTRAIGVPSGPADGQNISLLLVQPASGGPCAVTWASGAGGFDFGSAAAPSLSTSANAADLAAFRYSSLLGRWLFLGSAAGFNS